MTVYLAKVHYLEPALDGGTVAVAQLAAFASVERFNPFLAVRVPPQVALGETVRVRPTGCIWSDAWVLAPTLVARA